MKNVFLTILKEIGIFLIILITLAAVVAVTFKDQLPYEDTIPTGEEYVQANLKSYSVSSTDRISEVGAVTITHEANQGNILAAENDVRIQTGKYTPFGNISGTSDLPSEKVGVTTKIEETTPVERNNTKTTSSTSSDGGVEYPETEDMIEKIETEQSEDSASAASRRFSNEE